jgi:catechol 2,3-dioxygenase-like lactoylglutathione lyase family enzyme
MIRENGIKTTLEDAGIGAPNEVARIQALIGRRTFLKSLGLAATTAAVGGPGALLSAVDTAEAAVPSGLADAPVVMLCRHATDLGRCRELVGKTTGLPVLHQDADAVLYDGGSVVLAYDTGHASGGTRPAGLPRPRFLSEAHRPEPNPCRTIVHLSAGQCRCETFLDDDGNQSSLFAASRLAGNRPERQKLQEILTKTNGGVEAPVGALELLVSDLPRSTEFYAQTLGLRTVSRSDDEIALDLGTILLTLRPEPTGRLVELLNRTGRLLSDWAVFYVPDIHKAVASLRARGVRFPSGIETLAVGHVAYLSDPDGHPWVLWQPSGQVEKLACYPVLSRHLANI